VVSRFEVNLKCPVLPDVDHYNTIRLHSAIGYVTPQNRLARRQAEIHAARVSLHHVVAHAAGSDEDILESVRRYALAAMQRQGPVVAWVVDDTGLLKNGTHSVGVIRQYCGQARKQENRRVAVSLSISTSA
jgi:SRSO17 transposase